MRVPVGLGLGDGLGLGEGLGAGVGLGDDDRLGVGEGMLAALDLLATAAVLGLGASQAEVAIKRCHKPSVESIFCVCCPKADIPCLKVLLYKIKVTKRMCQP